MGYWFGGKEHPGKEKDGVKLRLICRNEYSFPLHTYAGKVLHRLLYIVVPGAIRLYLYSLHLGEVQRYITANLQGEIKSD